MQSKTDSRIEAASNAIEQKDVLRGLEKQRLKEWSMEWMQVASEKTQFALFQKKYVHNTRKVRDRQREWETWREESTQKYRELKREGNSMCTYRTVK